MTRQELLEKAKPILFNTEMVKAILEGRKTVTRRVVKHNVEGILNSPYHKEHPEVPDHVLISRLCNPPYAAGDYLYVRETWNISNMCADGNKVTFIYRGDKSEEDSARTISVSDDAFDKYDEMMYESMPEWRPSIHMPKEAARIFLKVTDVRAKRLRDMKLKDFLNEGVIILPEAFNDPDNAYGQAREEFEYIWNSTIKRQELEKYGWNANPWVWVIEFERITEE